MPSKKNEAQYNPFYIEPVQSEEEEEGENDDFGVDTLIYNSNNNNDINLSSTTNLITDSNKSNPTKSPTKPAKSVKTRNRGYSLRTQLLNNSMHQQVEQFLEPPMETNDMNSKKSKSSPRSTNQSVRFSTSNDNNNNNYLPSENIELKSVDNSYVPNDLDFVRNNDQLNFANNRFDTLITNESIIDLNDEMQLTDFNSNSKKSKIRLSGEDDFNPYDYNNGNGINKMEKVKGSLESIKQFKSPNIFKKIFILLTGARVELPSVGGRQIPIAMNISNTDFPIVKNKKNETLLIDERRKLPYVNNLITSSRYTIISFLPRQLFAQFSKVANCYFLLVSILQLIPSWSTTGTSTTIIPLCIFISISMLREGYEDIRRHKLDKQENNKKVKVLKEMESPNSLFESDMRFSKSTRSFSRLRPSGQSFDFNFEEDQEAEDLSEQLNSFDNDQLLNSLGIASKKTKWKDLKVGDIIKLESDEWVPADIVLLTSTNEMGESFIETMALDGETNLKARIPNIELHKIANKAKNLFNISGTVLSEDPNLDLYNFEGSLDLPNIDSQEMITYPLGPENVIYRGSVIRNTDSCLGMVIFTGEETKVRMNAIKNPRIKAPKLQRKINMIVGFMVFVVLTLSCFSLMAERLFYKRFRNVNWYIDGQDVGVAATIMGFIIMFNTMIPLSLYVTMEIIKAIQLLLLQWDIDMYHLPSDTPAEARAASILEELGQVSYIFSDKTGTLTDNVMLFRKFSVCGVPWIHDIDLLVNKEKNDDPNDISDVFSKDEEKPGQVVTAGRPSMASLTESNKRKKPKENEFDHHDIKSSLEFIKYIQEHPQKVFSQKASFFLLSIALCHTCLPRRIQMDIRDSVDSLEEVNLNSNKSQNSTIRNNGNLLNPFGEDAISRNSNDENNVYDNDDNDDDDDDDEKIEYQAASPDELALVQAACDMGFILFDRKQKILTLKTYPNGFEEEPEFTTYEILDVVEFSSARKRMSVIVKFPDGKIILFCKGADNIIMERLTKYDIVENKKKEIQKSVSQRRRAEAEFILNRKSIERLSEANTPRSSFTSNRLSSTFNRLNNSTEEGYENISKLLESNEADMIYKESKKSLEVENKKKYRIGKNQYIPPDNLITNDNFIIEKTLQHIDEFSSDGLRTLLYSYRELDIVEYTEWSKRYAAAKTSLVDRSEKIEHVGTEFENRLTLLGCTAIEDKLQDGVPEAIEKLRRAGIRMWMLTGDKRETAINIGYSCKLIKDYSTVVILSNEGDTTIDKISSIITAAEIELDEGNVAHCVVVIDGSTLSDIENDPTVMSLFISLGVKVDSVICCRASPSQKATMVTKVRELDFTKVTLAIGDGANDIAMIQSADVGIGITGKEGLQAARTSDFSIAQFRYLLKLLLVHGRYNYIRTSKFVLCTFYKELLFYLSQLLYQRYTLFTGSSLYESWSLSMFNTLFTSLPVLCIGMFDKDLKPSTLISVPELYSKGIKNETFNLPVFIQWVLLATTQSISLCFILWYIFGFSALIDNTTYPLGVIMFTVQIILINTKLNILEMHTITKLSIISWVISVFGWCVWCMLLVWLYKTKINTIFYVQHGLFEEFGTDPTFWATILILTVLGIWIDFIFTFIAMCFKTTDTEIFQRLEKDPRIEKKLVKNSYYELKQGWTWLHESQIKENKFNNILSKNATTPDDIDKFTDLNKKIYNFRSFMKKGSIHPTKFTQMRKRKGTMINPTELPPDSPSLVKINSNDTYIEEMLPNGEIVKIPKDSLDNNGNINDNLSNRTYRKFFKNSSSNTRGNDMVNSQSIDEILRQREMGLNDEE
ncbi:hypothetical protein C6P40_001322 [Pichia californica]|uniref:P-type phospholipid transporter n=1 Tax=Pichia californica TaxID=460514 RepID=A0A9P7BES2_9ASCO|nr:hypothetical protein C6P42_000279 [[Candida] californica]KAG0688171.1 hypothetical protein C6P40_001322 [[Candida] californica]